MSKTIPALPVRDVGAAVAHYRDRFGFEAPYVADDFAILTRDEAVLHLWGAADEQWRSREDLRAKYRSAVNCALMRFNQEQFVGVQAISLCPVAPDEDHHAEDRQAEH